MINAHNLRLYYGTQTIFDDVSFTINHNQRIGLVGRNGSGKSTLLRVIAGMTTIQGGSLALSSNKRIAYLPQEVVLNSKLSVLEETLSAYDYLVKLQQTVQELEPLLCDGDQEVLESYSNALEQLSDINPDSMRAETKKVLMGLGFSVEQMQVSVDTLSVGWKMRIVLAKLLLQRADFYLFDEPTNHLDIIAKDWFLQFLRDAPFGFMLVCHERYFLDKLTSHILELEHGSSKVYTGNFSSYEIQKEHNVRALEAAYNQQQRDIKRRTETIDRFKATASKAKMAQSMMRQLEKIELIEIPPKPPTIKFNFPPCMPSGTVVLKVKNVGQQFGDKRVFQNVSFDVERGEKVAIVAANGVGKSTLFNVIVGNYPIQKGSVDFGHNVHHAIFAQDQNATLRVDRTLVENLQEFCPNVSLQSMRTFLGAFLFDSDDIEKKAGVLSGGEKNRLGMIRVLLQKANLLLLDEPTNHLDIPSKEVLMRALQEYQGTVLFVSHDHDFINQLATRVIELMPTGNISYRGNYEEYLYYKKATQDQQNPSQVEVTTSLEKPLSTQKAAQVADNLFELKKRSTSLEQKIGRYEKEVEEIELAFAHLSYGTPEFAMNQDKLTKMNRLHSEAFQEWESLQKQILNS